MKDDLLNKMEYRLNMESILASISRKFVNVSFNNLDNEIHDSLKIIGAFADVDRSYVFLITGKEKMSNTHEWCRKGIEPQIENLKDIPVSSVPWWLERLLKFENIHVPVVSELPPEASAEKEILQAQDIKSLIVVPMVCKGELIGFIGFDSVTNCKIWHEEDILILRIVAEILSSAIDSKKSNDELLKFKTITDKKLAENETAHLKELEEYNMALKKLIQLNEKEKIALRENIMLNVEKNIYPIINNMLKTKKINRKNLDLLKDNIKNITSGFYKKLISYKMSLTPTEIKICELVKSGYIAKEIAELMHIAVSTVQLHKENIRKKLGLTNKSINLKSYLDTINE